MTRRFPVETCRGHTQIRAGDGAPCPPTPAVPEPGGLEGTLRPGGPHLLPAVLPVPVPIVSPSG